MSSKRYKFACVPIEDSDQHAHLRKLIRVFDGRAMGSQWTKDSSDRKPMHLSDWADKQTNFNLCCRHMSTMPAISFYRWIVNLSVMRDTPGLTNSIGTHWLVKMAIGIHRNTLITGTIFASQRVNFIRIQASNYLKIGTCPASQKSIGVYGENLIVTRNLKIFHLP